MENSRLVNLLYTLSRKELRQMQLFLASPFFNKRPEVNRLFDYLVECRHRTKVAPGKEKAFRFVAGKSSPYDDQQLRLWMSSLLKLLEKFLLYNAFFDDPIKTKIKLTDIYRQRNLHKQVERNLRELQKLQGQQPFRNADYFDNEFHIQREEYRHTSAQRRMSELNVQKMSDNLDVAYFARKLRQSCFAVTHQAVYKTEYQFGLLKEIMKYVKSQQLLHVPAIALFYHAYQTLTKPADPNHFRQFKSVLVQQGNKLPPEELGDLYIMAINFCIKQYNAGNRAYLRDELDIYRQGLQQNLFLKNGKLSRFTYRNVVTVGLVLEQFEWVEKFIYDYKNTLEKAHRESMFSFCLARLEYQRKNYGPALQLLQKSEYKDLLLNLAAKTVMLKIFYELDELTLLEAHLDAMRTFIRRKNIISYHRENYLNLIRYTRKLIETNPYDKVSTIQLHNEIESSKAIAEKGWLLKQCG